MLIAALIGSSSRRTVSSDSKSANGIRYGYQLESYRFRDRTFLRIWNSSGMSLDFDLPGYHPVGVEEARWIAADGTIYLRAAMVRRDGSTEKAGTLKLLYDFRSGELLISCPLPLWRTSADTNWLSDQQFEAALAAKIGVR